MSFFSPRWPVPRNVKSLVTTRAGGYSRGLYSSFNLAAHVGDLPERVEANRQYLLEHIGHPVSWIRQVHGCDVATLESSVATAGAGGCEADAVTTRSAGLVCAVLTADCLPLLICDRGGSQVAAVHAGWRGLAAGVITRAVNEFASPAGDLMVYLGPAISQLHFQVGEDVVEAFLESEKERKYAEPVKLSFKDDPQEVKKYRADLYRLAKSELNGLGVKSVFGGDRCTYTQSDKFYSYRRDGTTGRMASLIWLAG